MTTDILLKPQQLYKEYMSLIMKHDTLKTSLERTVAVISLAPGHGQGVSRRLEEMEAEILDLEKIIDKKCEELIDAQNVARKAIYHLQDPEQVAVMIKRYVDCMTFSEISSELEYTVRHCRRLNQNGLEKIIKMSPKCPLNVRPMSS